MEAGQEKSHMVRTPLNPRNIDSQLKLSIAVSCQTWTQEKHLDHNQDELGPRSLAAIVDTAQASPACFLVGLNAADPVLRDSLLFVAFHLAELLALKQKRTQELIPAVVHWLVDSVAGLLVAEQNMRPMRPHSCSYCFVALVQKAARHSLQVHLLALPGGPWKQLHPAVAALFEIGFGVHVAGHNMLPKLRHAVVVEPDVHQLGGMEGVCPQVAD